MGINKDSQKAPNLRFKGFTDDWEQRKLSDHADILPGGTPKTSITQYWEPKQIPWMSSGEVNNRRINKTKDMISEEGLNNSSARWVKMNSVLIALAGQGKTRGTVAINNIPLTTNQSIAAIVPNNKLHFEFIYHNLFKRYDELRMISSGDGTRGGLNKKIVSDIIINSPSINEQISIGTFLRKLDNTITLHQRKLDQLNQLKEALLQQMFPGKDETVPKLRFAGFEGDWEERKLGEISKIKTGSSDLQDADATGNYPFFVRSENIERSNRFLFEGEAILIPGEGRLGEIYHYINGKFDYHQRVYKISNFSDYNVQGLFVLYYLKNNFKRHALKYTVKATVDSLRLPTLLEFNIMVPNNEEQQHISNLLNGLEKLIQANENRINDLKSLKTVLLQNMFI